MNHDTNFKIGNEKGDPRPPPFRLMNVPGPTTFVFAVIAGTLFGLVSVPHCFGMCGPLHLTMCLAAKKRSFKSLTLFNLGRILGYTLLGAVFGFFGERLSGTFDAPRPTPATHERPATVDVPTSCCAKKNVEKPRTIAVPKSCCEAEKSATVAVPKSCCEAATASPERTLGLNATARRMLMFIFPAVILIVVGIKGILKRPAAVGTGGGGWLTRLFAKFQSGGPVACGVGASLIPCGMLYVAFAMAVGTVSAFLGGVFMLCYCLTITFFMQLGIMVGTTFGKKLGPKVDRLFPWAAFTGAIVYVALFFFWK